MVAVEDQTGTARPRYGAECRVERQVNQPHTRRRMDRFAAGLVFATGVVGGRLKSLWIVKTPNNRSAVISGRIRPLVGDERRTNREGWSRRYRKQRLKRI